MAAKKRKQSQTEDEELQDGLEPEVEVEVEPDEAPEPDSDSGSSGVTFEMGKMYIAGVDNEDDEESNGPMNIDEYEEIEDNNDLKKARDLITGAGSDDDSAPASAEEKDVFLENADYDPSEEWALGE